MQYILTTGWEDGVADLTQRLVHELAGGRRVLWLVSGGSNVHPVVQVMSNISPKLSRSLTVLLADERYGPLDHADSNWAQLKQAGFKGKQATLLPVLQTGLGFRQTLKRYAQLLEQAFQASDIIIAQMGVGADGHIAGIMVDSPAITARTLIAGFTSQEKPPLRRLTLTFPSLRRIHAAYVFAFGDLKRQALQTLRNQNLEPRQQPSQILKQLPEAYVYNDQLGEPE